MDSRNDATNNKHIIAYLKHYISLKAPRYAVLISGPWGSGKTHMIQRFLEDHLSDPPSRKTKITRKITNLLKLVRLNRFLDNRAQEISSGQYIYISLYGVTSEEEINDRIIASAFPGLGLKTSRIIGGIAKSALKYVKINIELTAKNFISKFHKNIYIFDDLERCEFPITKALGYINQFVEHGEKTVIIIADEDEIKDKEDYSRSREKLIGKTLSIKPPIIDATEKFIAQIKDTSIKNLMLENSGVFSMLFQQSGFKNLRFLQQALREIERPLITLTEEQFQNIEGVIFLAKLVFIYSFEVQSGRMTPLTLQSRPRQMNDFFKKHGEKNEQEKAFCQIETLYPGIDLRDPVLSNETLADIVIHGNIDAEKIQETIKQSHYFTTNREEPALYKLTYLFELNEAEFKEARAQFEEEYKRHAFTQPAEIFRSFALRRMLSAKKLLRVPLDQVIEQGDSYLDHLYTCKQFPIVNPEDYQGRDYAEFNGHYSNLSFEQPPPELNHFFKTFLIYNEKARQDRYPLIIKSLLQDMRNDPEDFSHRISMRSVEHPSLITAEILRKIDAMDFTNTLLKLHPRQQNLILGGFSRRYTFTNYSPEFSGEKEWLKELKQHLVQKAKSASTFENQRIHAIIENCLQPHIGYF
ncbi:P-loop NTPase fold protein [Pseudomonas helmanticensis]|uniref:P-loop NTPase fold protein n=1 Tax=Pseudomonas helmanticensis TaxID=1471381 RepID=UPI0037FC2FB3